MTEPIHRTCFTDAALGECSNPGFALSFLLKDQNKPEAKEALMQTAIGAQKKVHTIYKAAFEQRQARNPKSLQLRTAPSQRIAVGLGNGSPLGVGISLHHLYGTPVIHGSGLKGPAAHYCRDVVGLQDARFQRGGDFYRTIFGDLKDSGFIDFLDAWICPDSLLKDNEGLLPDVLTPHHQDYYGGKIYASTELTEASNPSLSGTLVPPTDFDRPVPVPFLSVRGKFEFPIGWLGDPNDPDKTSWIQIARRIVASALADWGVGGKTNSGYGRLA